MTSREEDEAWRAIVENYGERADLDDLDEARPGASDESGPSRAGAGVEDDEPAASAAAPSYEEPYDHEDGGFVPPNPPVHLPEPPRMLAWLGLFGSPALVLVFVVAGVTVPQWLGMAMLAAFIGGFGYLVWNMPGDPRNPWDDGSRI